jgi:hypothetical protein
MTPQQEAAEIFLRVFNALARASGKRLSAAMATDVRRACELLGGVGDELDAALEDAPRASPGEQAVPVEVERWKASRGAQR